MSGGQIMVVLIVAIVMIASIIRGRQGSHGRGRTGLPDAAASTDRIEAERLREEVRQLKERLQVLERITVDKEHSLAREIDDLRDR